MEAMLTPRRGTKILNPQAALSPIPIMNPRKVSTFQSPKQNNEAPPGSPVNAGQGILAKANDDAIKSLKYNLISF